MKTAKTLRIGFSAAWPRFWSYFISLLILWIVIVGIVFLGKTKTTLHETWIALSIVMFVLLNQTLIEKITNGARTLRTLRTPYRLWRVYFKGTVQQVMIMGTLVAASTVPLIAFGKLDLDFLSLLMVLSLVMFGSTLFAISSHGIGPRFLSSAWLPFIVFLIFYLAIKIELIPYLARLNELPVFIRIVLVFAWPVLGYVLIRTWFKNPPRQNSAANETPTRSHNKFANYLARFQRLNLWSYQARQWSQGTGGFISIFTFEVTMLLSPSLRYVSRGIEAQGFSRLSDIALIAFVISTSLVLRDFHWRFQLAPGHLSRGQFGWHLFRVNAVCQLVILLLLAALAITASYVFFEPPTTPIMDVAWRMRFAPLEFMLALGIAICFSAFISTLQSRSRWRLWVVILAFLGILGVWEIVGKAGKLPLWNTTQEQYAAGLVLGTALLVLLSNRLWTPKRIVAALRAR